MKILPPNVEQQIARVDRQKSLAIAIGSGLTALWCAYRVVWALYLAVTYNFLFGSLIFSVILWGVIGTVAAVAAIAFYTQYSKGPAGGAPEHPDQV
ncbi:hypothetical protein [Mycobacterium sp. DL592]|uniref:hypothetical protein n=1 Tax=Mycobacterium sp. DL592 TaxID=2675524 RepID=UPI001421B37C|nr:hypothetical protein [Mycobacterium sp. DL592]